jgi:HAD superfamily hydrolase (TIGR01509 family)
MITGTAVCFDAFGTLIRYNGPRLNPYRRLLPVSDGQRGERLPFLTRNAGIAVFADELGLSHLLPLIRRELDDEIAGLQLFPEAAPVLRRLRAAGKRLALCSNVAAEYGPAVRRLLPDLDAHVLSFEVGATKPDPAIYRAVCSALGSRPRDILFVGDSKRCDLHGPAAFGMQARWLNRKGGQTLVDVLTDYL